MQVYRSLQLPYIRRLYSFKCLVNVHFYVINYFINLVDETFTNLRIIIWTLYFFKYYYSFRLFTLPWHIQFLTSWYPFILIALDSELKWTILCYRWIGFCGFNTYSSFWSKINISPPCNIWFVRLFDLISLSWYQRVNTLPVHLPLSLPAPLPSVRFLLLFFSSSSMASTSDASILLNTLMHMITVKLNSTNYLLWKN